MSDTLGMDDYSEEFPGDPVLAEARRRFDRCAEWEAIARTRFIEDIKFAHGDSDNNYQWPNAIRRARDVDQKPSLTLNIVRQHNLQIINDSKQNKSAIRIRATGGPATKESSDCFGDVIRHIEYISNAQEAYATAQEFQVDGGIGYIRLATDWSRDETRPFDQEIYIRRIADPLTVYLDPDIETLDGSDAKFAFVFDTVPRDEFREAYPAYAHIATLQPMSVSVSDGDWLGKYHVRICEYFRKTQREDRHLSFVRPGSGERVFIRASRLPRDILDSVLDDPQTRSRVVFDDVVEWKLIVGEQVIDETEWPGRFIPLIRMVGVETVIDGILDRKGHTRAMKDPQRMFNYNASAQVEFVAQQGKTPWVAPAAAIEELENYWNTANQITHSVLPWNHIDDEGQPIPPPFRAQPPIASQAFTEGMAQAQDQIMQVSGQFQNQMGVAGNERTGEAIARRQGQSDTAVFHFFDNYAGAIRLIGRQLIDLIPKVYDTKRVLRIQAEDGTDLEIEVDPAARAAYLEERNHANEVVRRIFNPAVGQYDVAAGAGPAYGTRREETVKAMTMLLTQSPTLVPIIGDLLLSAMDFKEAQEAAQRMKRMVPPQALGKGTPQAQVELQQQVASLQAALAKAISEVARERLRLVGKDEMRDIDVYDAETKRISALTKALPMDADAMASLVHQLVGDSLATHLASVPQANASTIGSQS